METSIGESPVTQTAEVATKKASVSEMPEVVETGSSSSAVPVRIIERKPVVRSTDGGVFLIFLLKLLRPMWFIIAFFTLIVRYGLRRRKKKIKYPLRGLL